MLEFARMLYKDYHQNNLKVDFSLTKNRNPVITVSGKATNNQKISFISKSIQGHKQKNLLKNKIQATISFTYGKRMLINSMVQDFSDIKRQELLEVVDYDPVKNNLLVMGKADPKIETTLHFMIHHARKDVKIVVQINDKEILDITKEKNPVLEEKFPINSIDFIKLVLKELRESKIIGIKDKGILFVGKNITEIESLITKFYEEK